MSKEPETTPTTHDTETSEPAKDQRRYTFLSRHVSTLRGLRFSGILTILSAIISYPPLRGNNNAFGSSDGLFLGLFLAILPISIIWAWSSQKNAWRRLIALLVALFSVTSAGFLVNWWWTLYDQTSFNSTFLLALGLASVGLGLLIPTDLLLRGVRDHAGIAPGGNDDPSVLATYHASADPAATGAGTRVLHGILQFIRWRTRSRRRPHRFPKGPYRNVPQALAPPSPGPRTCRDCWPPHPGRPDR